MKKFLITVLVVSLLAAVSVSAFADDISETAEAVETEENEILEYKEGTAKEIADNGIVVIETEDGDITISDVILSDSVEVGKRVRYYENHDLLIPLDDDSNCIIDVFKSSDTLGDYVNSDETLAINISEDTPITDIAGNKLSEADIDGHCIIVIYNYATMSLPPITNPTKIVVLNEVQEDEADNSEIIGGADEEMEIYIEEEEINEYIADSVDAIEKNGITLVPVRKIAEALGYEVVWNGDNMSVTIGTVPMGVSFKISENSYSKAKAMAVELSAAPVLINDTTYVPIDFFEKILETKIVF